MSKAQILIVDDHPLIREGLQAMISREPDLEVSCEAGNSAEALKLAGSMKPDLAIVDISLPTAFSGLELIKQLRASYPALPILTLSMHDENLWAERALQAGAGGYIMKHDGTEKLVEAIRSVLAGNFYISDKITGKILHQYAKGSQRSSPSGIEALTNRELEVFELIGEGEGTRQVAEKLHLSTKTIDTHRAHIKEKLNLQSATELVQHAVRWVQSENLN